MIANIIIASLVAVSAGLFAWLFFLKMYDKLTCYKDTVEEITTNKFSELFLFVDISNYFYYYIAALLIFPIIAASLSGDISLGVLTFLAVLFSPYIILKTMIQKRLKKFEQQLPDALVMIAGSIRSGSSLPIALDSLIEEKPATVSGREARVAVEMILGAYHSAQQGRRITFPL